MMKTFICSLGITKFRTVLLIIYDDKEDITFDFDDMMTVEEGLYVSTEVTNFNILSVVICFVNITKCIDIIR